MAFGIQTIYEMVTGRHWQWQRESKSYLSEPANKNCIFCGRLSQVVHHEIPVAVNKSLEMEKSNWHAVCHDCHWDKCHLRNWRTWVVNIRAIAKLFRDGIRGPAGETE